MEENYHHIWEPQIKFEKPMSTILKHLRKYIYFELLQNWREKYMTN